MKGKKQILFVLAMLTAVVSYSQYSITTGGMDNIISFQGTIPGVSQGAFQGEGFEPNPSVGRLDSDAWEIKGLSSGECLFGDTQLSNDFARGTSGGGTGTGGVYCFIPFSGNFTLGIQPTNADFTPGTITLKAVNNTGLPVDSIGITYDIWTYNDQDNSTKLSFSHASDNIDNAYTAEPSVEYTSPEDASIPLFWSSTTQSVGVFRTILPGEEVFFRWTYDVADPSGGARDEISIDDITINFRNVTSSNPIIAFSQPTAIVNEGAGSYFANITIDTTPTEDITVNINSSDGTALSVSDYDPVNTSVTFTPTSPLTQTVEVTGLDDAIIENDETFDLNLSLASGDALLGTNLQVITIQDNDASCPNAGDIIVSEIMINPDQVSDGRGEWIELYNTSPNDIDIGNWVLKDADNDFHTINQSLVIPSMGYVVLGRNSDMNENGGVNVDYVYSNFALGNSDDEVILECDGSVIDEVFYLAGTSFPDGFTASLTLDPPFLDHINNDNGASWCNATSPYGDGDAGTPGAPNDFCSGCSLTLEVTDINCSTITTGADLYSVEIAFTGGGTETYGFIESAGIIDLSGDDPSLISSGTFFVNSIPEGTNLNLQVNSTLCDFSIDVSAPICDPSCAPGSIVITEIMNNPRQVDDIDGEWIELYNTTTSDIDIQGWTLSDDGSDFYEITASVVVPAGGYVVLAKSINPALNGGLIPDYAFDAFEYYLFNGNDEIILSCSGAEIDRVNYSIGSTFPDNRNSSGFQGYALSLDQAFQNATDNDDGANWCLATTTYGDGDFGTPGVQNPLCLPVYDTAVEVCESVGSLTSTGSGTWQQLIYNGEIVMEINDQGEALGLVTVDLFITAVGRENGVGQNYLNRTLYVTTENAVADEVMVRMYFTQQELTDLITDATGDPLVPTDENSLVVIKVDDACSPSYPSPATNPVQILPVMHGYGGDFYAEFVVDGFSGFFLAADGLILPVELISFTGEKIDDGVLLEWSTASEENNSHFEVERSADGFHWTVIGEVVGNTTFGGVSNYRFIDSSPQNGYNLYRLKQVDLDGVYAYSEIVSISYNNNFEITYINAVEMGITLPKAGLVTANIYNVNGQIVAHIQEERAEGLQTINLPNELASGFYIVEVTNNKTRLTKKFAHVR